MTPVAIIRRNGALGRTFARMDCHHAATERRKHVNAGDGAVHGQCGSPLVEGTGIKIADQSMDRYREERRILRLFRKKLFFMHTLEPGLGCLHPEFD